MSAIAQSLYAAIGSRARDWARKRQGPDPASTQLTGNRIYILPTRAGLIFAAIVFTMLLGAMNYNNNMGFALTFLLAGVGIISIHHCHRNLAEVWIHYLGAGQVFAGERISFRFALENRSIRARWQMHVEWDDRKQVCDELMGESRQPLNLGLATARRGPIPGPRIQLSTRYPLGLFRAWGIAPTGCEGCGRERTRTQAGQIGTGE